MSENVETHTGLSENDIQRENEFLADIPFLNWGAFFMAPIWGIAHGDWPAVLFYPLWIFCDNLVYFAWMNPSTLNIVLAGVTLLVMGLIMLAYARVSSPRSAHRAAQQGYTLEQYLKREKQWAVGMAIIAIVMLALATWYNLCIRPSL